MFSTYDLTGFIGLYPGESKNKSGSGGEGGEGGEGGGGSSSAALESLGSRLSLLAWVDMFRIDIVVSDLAARDRRHSKGKG